MVSVTSMTALVVLMSIRKLRSEECVTTLIGWYLISMQMVQFQSSTYIWNTNRWLIHKSHKYFAMNRSECIRAILNVAVETPLTFVHFGIWKTQVNGRGLTTIQRVR